MGLWRRKASGGGVRNLFWGTVQTGGTLIQSKTIDTVHVYDRTTADLPDPAEWPPAKDWDGLLAGVHRARPGAETEALPEYVKRDADERLGERLGEAAGEGGLVLVTGDSTAGKTRAAFEALRSVLPGHRVHAPSNPADLRAGATAILRTKSPCVVWLDDLERFLGPGGFDTELLTRLRGNGTPVVATMRLKQWASFTSPVTGGSDREDGAHAAKVLNSAERVNLDRLWSDQELLRAGDSADTRVLDALEYQERYGLAEYLAAGPGLLEKWRAAWTPGGSPRGAALVAAAVDLARTGLIGPYPRSVLLRLHQRYLDDAGGRHLRPESEDEAFSWAASLHFGATSLLLPGETGDSQTWEPFDYLVDHAEEPVAPEAWDEALVHAKDPEQRFQVGVAAVEAKRMDVVERAWRPIVHLDPDIGMMLGSLFALMERDTEAEEMFRSASREGSLESSTALGLLLARTGQEDEAEVLLRQRAGAGSLRAMFVLAELLRQTGRENEAEEWHRRGAIEGSVPAQAKYGMLLMDLGRAAEAETWLERAVEQENSGAIAALGLLLMRTGREDEVGELFARASTKGSFACLRLGMGRNWAGLLAEPRKAELEFRRTHVLAHMEAASGANADILYVRPDTSDEDEYLRRRVNQGDVYAALSLAGLAPESPPPADDMYGRATAAGISGDNIEAAEIVRSAAEAGDARARSILITALLQQGRVRQALPFLRVQVQEGKEDDIPRLAETLSVTGHEEEAERYTGGLGAQEGEEAYRRGLYFQRSLVLSLRDRSEENLAAIRRLSPLSEHEAEELGLAYYRYAARLGHTEAAIKAADLLEKAGKPEEAAEYRRRAADAGHRSSSYKYALWADTQGRTQTAEQYFRRAADAGHTEAIRRLRRLLVASGRRAEAKVYRRQAAIEARRQRRLAASPSQKVAWTLLILGSCGFLAWAPFLYLTVRRGRGEDWLLFSSSGGLTLMTVVGMVAGQLPPALALVLQAFVAGGSLLNLLVFVFDPRDD